MSGMRFAHQAQEKARMQRHDRNKFSPGLVPQGIKLRGAGQVEFTGRDQLHGVGGRVPRAAAAGPGRRSPRINLSPRRVPLLNRDI